uniref:Uncharacterized protein n=1 Tax=Setaria italica TaxID=4555 RepID=K3Z1K7_SETIT
MSIYHACLQEIKGWVVSVGLGRHIIIYQMRHHIGLCCT